MKQKTARPGMATEPTVRVAVAFHSDGSHIAKLAHPPNLRPPGLLLEGRGRVHALAGDERRKLNLLQYFSILAVQHGMV